MPSKPTMKPPQPPYKLPPLPPRAPEAARRRAARIYAKLDERYPNADCALIHDGPYQLLIATLLSAQCTDVLVNKVTPGLFAALPDAHTTAEAELEQVEQLVNKINFWRNKAKNLRNTAKILVEKYDGEVPPDMNKLVELPGVARKTANVVLGNAFNINYGIVVDTHVGRLSRRFGFTEHEDPKKIEQDLMALFPRAKWTKLSHLLILHGRAVCKARHNLCADDAICRGYCSAAKES